MTDKELDKLFREKFAAAEHEFQESSWEKAKTLIEREDPAVVDDLVRKKFAAQKFAFNEGAWVAAKSMIDAMYRRIWLREWTARIAVFAGVLALTFGADSLFSNSLFTADRPVGRPAVAFVPSANDQAPGESIARESTRQDQVGAKQQVSSIQTSEEVTERSKRASSEGRVAQASDGIGGVPKSPSIAIAESSDERAESAAHLAAEAEKDFANEKALAAGPEAEVGQERSGEGAEAQIAELEPEVLEAEEEDEVKENRPSSPRPSAPGMFNPIKGKSSYFGFALGARVYEDFASTGTGQVHVAPTVGLRYAYMFYPKLSMNIGAHYSYRRSTHSAHQFTGASYSFGAHEHTMDMVSVEMHQADIPLYIRYQVARGHFIYTGAYASVTLASKNETSSKTTVPFLNDIQYAETRWGHMPGLREWGYGLILGYDLRLNENWQIGIRGQWGLVDWSDNAVFVDSPYDRNKEIKLLIEYRLND